jgi:hypothetical protein
MRRFALPIAALLLSVHCSKGSPPTPKAQPGAAQPAGQAAAAPALQAPAAEPAAEAPRIEITEARVARYAVYLADIIPAQRAILQQSGEGFRKVDQENGLKQTADAVDTVQKAQRAADEAERRAEAKAGLSKEEVGALSGPVGEVLLARLTASQQDSAVQAMEQQMRESVAKLPADQRAEAEKSLGELTQGLKDLKDAKESRKAYGDQAVDAILKHEAELAPLLKQALGAPR